jgi:DNA-binding NtrC family response regulator
VKYFMQRSGREVGVDAPSIQPEAIVFLQSQVWPGNVRELENVVRQALLLARNYPIGFEHAQEAYGRTRKSVLVSDQTIAGIFQSCWPRLSAERVLPNGHKASTPK